MSLSTPQQDLLTFGIWANYYSTVKNTHNLDTFRGAKNASFGLKAAFNVYNFAFFLMLMLLV